MFAVNKLQKRMRAWVELKQSHNKWKSYIWNVKKRCLYIIKWYKDSKIKLILFTHIKATNDHWQLK